MAGHERSHNGPLRLYVSICFTYSFLIHLIFTTTRDENGELLSTASSSSSSSSSSSLLIRNELEEAARNTHLVVDANHYVLQDNLYWLIISDMVNLLSHRSVALYMLSNERLVSVWLDLVARFQSMNLSVRQFDEHVLIDQPTYFSSFSAELEFCSSVMWSMLQHAHHCESGSVLAAFVRSQLDKLAEWLTQVGIASPTDDNDDDDDDDAFLHDDDDLERTRAPNNLHLSFHLPLHRYLAATVYTIWSNASAAASADHHDANAVLHTLLADVSTKR